MKSLFRFFSSLKLAVVVILALALSLAIATFVESAYDTKTARFWVYNSWWFLSLLTLLGVNILVVALSRLPWKWRHTPFLLAHLGILILLTGSFLTQKYGLDGSLRISEGELSNVVELDDLGLVIVDRTSAVRVPVKWIPPEVDFKKISLKDRGLPYDLTIDRYLTHADANYNFLPDATPNSQAKPAVRVRIQGGAMAISQQFWLWQGDPSWMSVQAGPALLALGNVQPPHGRPSLVVTPNPDGSVRFQATSSEGKAVTGTLAANKAEGYTIDPGWKGGVKLILEKWIPRALPQTTYKASRIQSGQNAPPSAIHLVTGHGGEGSELWLGLGERAVLDLASSNGAPNMHEGSGTQVELGYFPERVILPFQVKLDHFKIDHYDGTRDPSSYSSQVTVLGQTGQSSTTISMNEPLHYMGTTLYQASYEDAEPRPITSIFAVNRDPGRIFKYIGSLLIVLGSILLFAMKYIKKKVKA